MNRRRRRVLRVSTVHRRPAVSGFGAVEATGITSGLPKKGIVAGIVVLLVAAIVMVSAGYIRQIRLKFAQTKGAPVSAVSQIGSTPSQSSTPFSVALDHKKMVLPPSKKDTNTSLDEAFLEQGFPPAPKSSVRLEALETTQAKPMVQLEPRVAISHTARDASTLASTSKSTKTEKLKAERERRIAERKRSQLETAYENHAISDEAYKRGQAEYRQAITHYRQVMSSP
jgi:hypothetical protein